MVDNKNTNMKGNKNGETASSTAHAPYNFIKLNDRIVKATLAEYIDNENIDFTEGYRKFINEKGKYSGYFEINIKNYTPLYIGAKDGFFNNGKDICIPGSSLRGCFKNLFKIITNSAFRTEKSNPDMTDKHLYFRSFASACEDFKDAYNDRMTIKDGDKEKHVAKAGFLVKRGRDYFVIKADKVDGKINGFVNNEKWHYEYNGQDYIAVYTGHIDSKKHYYKIYAPEWSKAKLLPVPEHVINGYRDDKNRRGVNIFANPDKDKKYRKKINIYEYCDLTKNYNVKNKFLFGAGKYSFVAPCFYVDDGKEVKHFGSGPYYRIPYLKSTGEHVPDSLKQKTIDFTDAVFGDKECCSSRVFFEDLYLASAYCQKYKKAWRKILATPNPTSFQMYLETNDEGKAAHWDAVSNIRGYKLYWHNNTQWEEKYPKYQNTKMTCEIEPLEKQHVFTGKIRFENLDEIELGALSYLIALGMENGICYKLGMGKSIGMGTVKITGKLFVDNDDYYRCLFTNNGFACCDVERNLNDFVDKFNKYMQGHVGSYELYRERLRELRLIMDYGLAKNSKWSEKVKYMDFKADKDLLNSRTPLPSITEVVDKK